MNERSTIDALRAQVRRARLTARLALGLALVFPLLALGPGASLLRADRVEAREIDLVDEHGVVVIELRADAGGSLTLRRPDGDAALALGERRGTRRVIHVGDAGMRGWGVLGELDPDGFQARPEPAGTSDTPGDAERALNADLRPLDGAGPADRRAAAELASRGWVYVMPRPKSASAAWGRTDRRATWFNGYWTNERTGAVSSTTPTGRNDFAGDGKSVDEWRYGGSPDAPSVIEWLCSREGGIEPEG